MVGSWRKHPDVSKYLVLSRRCIQHRQPDEIRVNNRFAIIGFALGTLTSDITIGMIEVDAPMQYCSSGLDFVQFICGILEREKKNVTIDDSACHFCSDYKHVHADFAFNSFHKYLNCVAKEMICSHCTEFLKSVNGIFSRYQLYSISRLIRQNQKKCNWTHYQWMLIVVTLLASDGARRSCFLI